MMTRDEFITAYTGVLCGDTPENFGQCVGLIEKYNDECFGYPHIWGNAKDLLSYADQNYFTVEFNDPNNLTQVPPVGAVMVWDGTWGGGFGHTGVLTHAVPNSTMFTCFEQNNPAGHAPEINMHLTYKGVLGWLIPKPLPAAVPVIVNASDSALSTDDLIIKSLTTPPPGMADTATGSEELTVEDITAPPAQTNWLIRFLEWILSILKR